MEVYPRTVVEYTHTHTHIYIYIYIYTVTEYKHVRYSSS